MCRAADGRLKIARSTMWNCKHIMLRMHPVSSTSLAPYVTVTTGLSLSEAKTVYLDELNHESVARV
jgi:hypothetical protein